MAFITAFCQPPAICRPLGVSSAVSNNPVRRLRNYQRSRRASVCMNTADDLNTSKQSDTETDNTENNGATPTSTAPASPTIDSQNVQSRQDTAVQNLEDADDFGVPAVAQAPLSVPAAQSSSSKKQYSMRTRLREEIEAPFRKARMFVYAGSAASAGVGAFISTLRVIAALTGVPGVQPLNETVRQKNLRYHYTNLGDQLKT